MKLLAVETSTEACSAALLWDEEVFELSELAPRRHNEIILSMCKQVLAFGQANLSQLDAIAFGRGPGAFTGVRLAASVTQGIALGQDLPVVSVSSLAALSQAAFEENQSNEALACIDARMQEVYLGQYKIGDHKIMQLVNEEIVIAPHMVNIPVSEGCFGVGTGWKLYAQILQERIGKNIHYAAEIFPQAKYIASIGKVYFKLGQSISAVDALPVYLRDKVAEKPKNKMVF